MNIKSTLGTGLRATKKFGKAIATKENGITAAKVLAGVGIGIGASVLGTSNRQRMFGGKTKVRNNKKIAIIGAGVGLGTATILAVKNTVPKMKEVLDTVTEVTGEN